MFILIVSGNGEGEYMNIEYLGINKELMIAMGGTMLAGLSWYGLHLLFWLVTH